MREAVGGTWLTGIVIVFMLLFVAFLALSINYTKAFQIKNDIISMIEKREGFTDGDGESIELINNYLKSNAYHIKGKCSEGSYGVSSLDVPGYTLITKNDKNNYYYCVRKINAKNDKYNDKVYYKVNIFFYFNLPVIGEVFKFNIDGVTMDVPFPADSLEVRDSE